MTASSHRLSRSSRPARCHSSQPVPASQTPTAGWPGLTPFISAHVSLPSSRRTSAQRRATSSVSSTLWHPPPCPHHLLRSLRRALFEAAPFASNLGHAGRTSAVVDIIAELTLPFNYAWICMVLHADYKRYNPFAKVNLLARTHAYGVTFAAYLSSLRAWPATAGSWSGLTPFCSSTSCTWITGSCPGAPRRASVPQAGECELVGTLFCSLRSA